MGKLKETHAREILAALDDLKAVDPACGSGAYLLGLLQEMIVLYRLLYSEKLVKDARTLYDLKLRIISQSLYGVDIDPFATNIAKLRLWLSLAVEADKPVPLPNLDFKIETGDSLLAPDPQEMPDLSAACCKHRRMCWRWSRTSSSCAWRGKGRVIARPSRRRRPDSAQNCMRNTVRAWLTGEFSSLRHLHRPGGFDIVLANPPYVRMELLKDIKPVLKQVFSTVHAERADLFVFFYARTLTNCSKRRRWLLHFVQQVAAEPDMGKSCGSTCWTRKPFSLLLISVNFRCSDLLQPSQRSSYGGGRSVATQLLAGLL